MPGRRALCGPRCRPAPRAPDRPRPSGSTCELPPRPLLASAAGQRPVAGRAACAETRMEPRLATSDSLVDLRTCARKPRAPARRSVEPDRLVRAVEREGGDPDPEAVTASGFHLVAAHHDPGRGRQGGAAGVFEAFAGSEHRLLADDAGASHLLHLPAAVGDLPMPVAQRPRLQTAVLDADMIGPDVTSFGRRGLILEVERLYADFDRSRDFRIHRRCSSLSGSARSPAAPIRRSTRTMSAGYRKPSRSPRRSQELERPIGDKF